MRILRDVLKKDRMGILSWIVFTAVSYVVFRLYDILLEPFYYALILSLVFMLVYIAEDVIRTKRRSSERAMFRSGILYNWKELPEPDSIEEADYQNMIRTLGDRLEQLSLEFDEETQDSIDYYTTWVHQIKTPIAVMKLKLAEDTPENRALAAELFKIEQYVDMVLQYVRLGSSVNDLVVREYQLDELIRETVRKYAEQFIERRIRLEYEPVNTTIVTDRKWFICILEQFISNALKYTPEGSISITCDGSRLTVADTGIGIAPEDIRRIFEKGFTGVNGRLSELNGVNGKPGAKSSGLGLYLARKAADMLNLSLEVESGVNEGSRFSIILKKQDL